MAADRRTLHAGFFALASSMFAFGTCEPGPIDERHLPSPERAAETRRLPAGQAERPVAAPLSAPLPASGAGASEALLTPTQALPTDLLLAASIRATLANDESLSYAARHVAVEVDRGAVTLRGPVESAADKARVAALVLKMRQVRSVTDKTEVRPEPRN